MMKKFVLIVFSIVLFSCNSDSPEVEKSEENLSISKTDTLEYFLAKAMPVEGGFSISQQANNFSISEIQHRENGVFYIYAAEEGFTGNEVVKITRKDSDGAKVYSETISVLNIEVTE